VPQALNRYAATPLGQPGVYQAVASIPPLGLWALQQTIKVPTGLAAGKYLFEPRWGETFSRALSKTGWLRVSVQAEKQLNPESLQHFDVISRQAPGLGRRIRGLFQDGWRTALSDAYDVETRVGRIHNSLNITLADATGLNINILERETAEVFSRSSKAILADLGTNILLDVAFQVGQDWGNPYLDPTQLAGRAFVAGVGGGVSGGVGLGVSGALIWAGVETRPAGWVGLGAGLVIDWVWGDSITPWIYERRGLNPERDLSPLGASIP